MTPGAAGSRSGYVIWKEDLGAETRFLPSYWIVYKTVLWTKKQQITEVTLRGFYRGEVVIDRI